MSRRILIGIVVVLVAFLSISLVPIGGVDSADVIPPVPIGDVNGDGRVNVLDMVLIGQHWGETWISPEEPWIVLDVNGDGVINIQDMILIGQHWTG